MSHVILPQNIGAADFDALHDDPAAWRDALASIGLAHSSLPLRQMTEGTVLVGLFGQHHAIKLYPPFLRASSAPVCPVTCWINSGRSLQTNCQWDRR